MTTDRTGRRHRTGCKPSTPVLLVLSAGPKSLSEIEDAFQAYGRRFPDDPRPYLGSRTEATKLERSLAVAVARSVETG